MIRLMRAPTVVCPATLADEEVLARLLLRATCLYPSGLSLTAGTLLAYPLQFTVWERKMLRGYLGASMLRPSTARIEALAIRHRQDVDYYLRELLTALEFELRERGTEVLIYIGQDLWLMTALKSQGFEKVNSILLFRKQGWDAPTCGNDNVCVRPAISEDIPALVRLDEAAFGEDMWRNGAEAFQQCLNRMALFVVAEQKGQVVGYQFSYMQGEEGYVARVAVHPRAQDQRIGARLLADAIHFFQRWGVRQIVLNTQKGNHRAQRLYSWFGFQLVKQEALVLRRTVGVERSGTEGAIRKGMDPKKSQRAGCHTGSL
jgi:ribosomal protein S18 acetylase RimI-like enzyme